MPDTNVSDGADIGAFEAQPAPSGALTVPISDRSLNDGNAGTTNFTFTVSLSAASGASVMVVYQTADGTADTSDYAAVAFPTTLTFNGGETSKSITIAVNRTALGAVTVTINGTPVTVTAAQASATTIGFDELRLSLPASGGLPSGLHNLSLTVDGSPANIVKIQIQ